MTLLFVKPAFLVVICAASYAMSAVAMAAAAHHPRLLLFVAIALCLGVAAVTEIMALRQLDLGVTYIAIIGAESLLVVALAGMIGEGLGPRELLGAAMVIAGTVVLGT